MTNYHNYTVKLYRCKWWVCVSKPRDWVATEMVV